MVWVGVWVVGSDGNKANSAPLELGLELGNTTFRKIVMMCQWFCDLLTFTRSASRIRFRNFILTWRSVPWSNLSRAEHDQNHKQIFSVYQISVFGTSGRLVFLLFNNFREIRKLSFSFNRGCFLNMIFSRPSPSQLFHTKQKDKVF